MTYENTYPMFIRTPADLGALIRDRRKQLHLDQATFAKHIGVSRQWVVAIERGHTRAPLGLVLRAIDSLGIRLNATTNQTSPTLPGPAIDINKILARAKKRTS